MNTDSNALGGLSDIEPPVVPVLYVLENATLEFIYPTLLFTGLFLAIAVIAWKYQFSPKGKARRRIGNLQRKYIAERINDRDVACELTKIFLDYLDQPLSLKLMDFPNEISAHKMHWKTFTEQLSITCYAAEKVEKMTEVSLLFDSANFWLKTWPIKKHG